MAHSLSARKRHRQSLRRAERNKARRSAMRTQVRKAREAIAAGSQGEAEQAVRQAVAVLDRTARKGTIHRNQAARRKSRLMRQLNALASGEAPPKPAVKRASRSKKS